MDLYDELQKTVDALHEKLEEPTLEIETKKINQKLRAAKFNPGDVEPLADCMLAILLAARSEGHSVKSVFERLRTLADEIGRKRWKKMPDGTYRAL